MNIWDNFLKLDTNLQTGLIAAVVSLLTFFITLISKNYLESKSYSRKLNKDYSYEQRKKVKDTLAIYKGHILNSASDLNGRFKNLTKFKRYDWLEMNGGYINNRYYFKSSLYRILSFYAWLHLLKEELIYMDTVISEKEDIEFLKFIHVFPLPFHDGDLVNNITTESENDELSYDERSQDLIFRDVFNCMFLWMITEDKKVITYEEFLLSYETHIEIIKPLCEYLDGINPNENRFRWDRIFIVQLLLIAFLNKFGYDYHRTNFKYLKVLIVRQGKFETFKNLNEHIFEKFKIKSKKIRLVKFLIWKYSS